MKRGYTIIVVLLVIIAGIIYLNNNKTSNDELIEIAGTIMGTSYHIKLAPSPKQKIDREAIKTQIDARLIGIDSRMSTYRTDSDISRFNRYSINRWMEISAETMKVVSEAQKISLLSHGAFDITIGNLVNLWGFGPTISIDEFPNIKTLQDLLPQVGYNKLDLRQSPPSLRKKSNAIYLDLSAIAKGYAVDAVSQLLRESHIENYLVEIGGEIMTHGHKQHQRPWVIGIESPVAGQRSIRRKINLPDVAMATSGDYRNFFEHEGVRYSHTIDPATGFPIKHSLVSATVIDQSCMRADAMATAIMVMGPDKGFEFAAQHNLAIFMLLKQDDRYIEKYSLAFEPYLKTEEH